MTETESISEKKTDTQSDRVSDERIIKKYPNRRLYDTAISSYITLDDVKRLVVEQVPVKVIDARTQEDITHNTLLQIIFDQEENGPSLFTTELLQKMIRFYGDSMQVMFGKMFEQGLKFFKEQQGSWQNKVLGQAQTSDPMHLMTELTKNNLEQWQQFQQSWLKNFQQFASYPDYKKSTQGADDFVNEDEALAEK